MPWICKVSPGPHPVRDCEKPDSAAIVAARAAIGSTWRCDDCGREWRYDGSAAFDAMTGRECYPKWTELPSGAADPAAMWASLKRET
jgi:hypothetical protein